MTCKAENIYSFFVNSKSVFDNDKDLNLNSVNIFKFRNASEFIKKKCSTFISYIRNGHFTYNEYKLYVLHSFMMSVKKLSWSNLDPQQVSKIKRLFSTEQYEKDNLFVEELCKRIECDISELYEINSDGNNMLLNLILKNKISPWYYVIHYSKGKKYFENIKYEVSHILIRVNKVANKINRMKNK